jgi:hypothetical protein
VGSLFSTTRGNWSLQDQWPGKKAARNLAAKTHGTDGSIFFQILERICTFVWFCLPPQGRSGGILVGVNTEALIVRNVDAGEFCVKIHLRSKLDGFEWSFIAVYGADAQKSPFLAELVRMCEKQTLPILIGADFNIIRSPHEKNNNNYNTRWSFVFNAIIESLNLREIVLTGRQYTWASRRQIPTYEKLDRVLASVDWEHKFPLVSVRALARSGSDHTPLLIDSGEQAHLGNKA